MFILVNVMISCSDTTARHLDQMTSAISIRVNYVTSFILVENVPASKIET